MKASNEGDAYATRIITSKTVDSASYPEYQVEAGILRYKNRVFIGSANSLRTEILSEIHDTSFGGHSSIMGTYSRLKAFFYWPNMKKEVEEIVRGCDICQRNKANHSSYPGLLQPLPIPDKVWTHIS